MNFGNVSEALSLVFDTLMKDKESEKLITMIDEAENDEGIKEGLRLAIKRLEIVNPSVCKVVQDKVKGFI